ncbi:MAG: hypothetical protein ACLPYZ_02690 [Limisphaerales bacterium]
MNTPDINPGNSVNSGLDFSNILGFLQTLMAMKSGGGGAAAKPANAGPYGGGPGSPQLSYLMTAGPGSPQQTFFNDTGIAAGPGFQV